MEDKRNALDDMQLLIDRLKTRKPNFDTIIVGSNMYDMLEKMGMIETIKSSNKINEKYNIKEDKKGIWKKK